ncbi:hypothetical protein HPP92_025360 [Vanilla planifolia]|uniref:Uncharacterized protein n=1 Tax=Vanilla planifolia TaxID=51239 RepID=A0A835UAZ0_VANPL|nr:hypothetical protein HPP92_025360 [Vanilla planifolia]
MMRGRGWSQGLSKGLATRSLSGWSERRLMQATPGRTKYTYQQCCRNLLVGEPERKVRLHGSRMTEPMCDHFVQNHSGKLGMKNPNFKIDEGQENLLINNRREQDLVRRSFVFSCATSSWFSFSQVAQSSVGEKIGPVYEIGELFELGIQLSYLVTLVGLLGLGTFFVIRQLLVRRELDLSAKELQELVRSGGATATEYFELGAIMLRRKVYPAATKYLQQAINKWDRDDQDLAQVYNALGVSYVRDKKLDEGIAQFKRAVRLQPGYVTAWNNLGDAYERKKDLRSALKAFEEVLLFDPNNKVARPRRDALKERLQRYKGVPLKSEER